MVPSPNVSSSHSFRRLRSLLLPRRSGPPWLFVRYEIGIAYLCFGYNDKPSLPKGREGMVVLCVRVFTFVDAVLLNPVGILPEVVEVFDPVPEVVLHQDVSVEQEIIQF